MRGIHWLKIVTKDCKYNLTLRRNITVVRGDSGTGKSSIVKHVRRYLESNGDYNITLESDCNVVVLSGDFELDSYKLSKTNNSIIIIDEGMRYLGSNEFKHCVEDSSNYFVLITRCNLSNLPFSYKEIYSLVTRKNNGEFISWERYFTHLVEEISSASGHHYNKHSLNKRYKTSGNIIKFINAMPKEIRP